MEITPHFLSSCVKSCFIYLYGCTLDFCSLFLQPCLRKRHQLRFACSVWPLFISLLRMQEQKGSGALGISLCGILQLPVWWGGRSSFWICRGNALPHGTELGQVCTPTTLVVPTRLPEMQELKYIFRCPNHHRSKDLCLKLLRSELMTNSCCSYNPR